MAKKEPAPTCKHVKPNGSLCESPALHDEDYCFFHRDQRERLKRQLRAARKQKPLELAPLEDLESIHIAIGDVLNALLADRIDHKKAGLLLYGLQTAAATIRQCRFRTDEYTTHRVRYTDRERYTLRDEIEQELDQEEAAEQRAAARSARKKAQPAAEPAPPVEPPPQPSEQPPADDDLPGKKPAIGVSNEMFWDVVGEMASRNAQEVSAEARRLLEAADYAKSQKAKHKTG